MGGQSEQKTTQDSQTAPWEPAQGLLTGILGKLGGYLDQTGLNGRQSGALDQLAANGQQASDAYSGDVQNYIKSLLGGGGALNQAGGVQNGYDQYVKNISGLADNTNYDPMSTPGLGTQLQAVNDAITKQVGGQFAAAGRDGSAYNQRALATGLAQGEAPIITNQYNQNVRAQQEAAGNMYNASNTNAGILSALQQQDLANRGAGMAGIPGAMDVKNMGANAILQSEAARLGIPMQALGLLAQIGIPIAGLGSQSHGTSDTQKQDSGMQQFMQFGQGLGSLLGGIGGLWGGGKK